MSWVQLIWLILLVASPFIYLSGFDEDAIIIFGNFAKIFALFVAGLSLTLTQNAYSSGDTPKRAWTHLAGGMWTWMLAQILFAHYKLILKESPYPSVADVFFVMAYLPLIVALIILIRNFKSTGLPMGSTKSYAIQIGLLLILYMALFSTLLWPLLTNEDPVTLKLLNAGYPTCDFILIAMTSILIRISWTLRGGSLARSWILLGLGFILIGVADVIFAYQPRPFLDILFFSAYFLIALSGVYQLRMLHQ